MTSWRDSVSRETQDDLDGLLDTALPLAVQQLEKHGELLPYAVALGASGEAQLVAGDPGQGEHPSSSDVLSTLIAGLRQDRDDLRAVALVSDVRLTASDAVRVELEHRHGPAITVFLPYRRSGLRRKITFDDLAAGSGTSQVWSP